MKPFILIILGALGVFWILRRLQPETDQERMDRELADLSTIGNNATALTIAATPVSALFGKLPLTDWNAAPTIDTDQGAPMLQYNLKLGQPSNTTSFLL